MAEPRRRGSSPADAVRAQIDRIGQLMQDEPDPLVAAVGAELSAVAVGPGVAGGTEFARLVSLGLIWALGELEGREF